MSESSELAFGPFRLLSRNGPLLRAGEEIKLAPKSLAVMWTLLGHRGNIVTREALMDAVWPGAEVGEEALTYQIQTLRRAIEDDPKTPRYLLTAHRIGFRLVVPEHTAKPADTRLFVGRDVELAALEERFALAERGERQMVFVTGEPGIGKTTLIEAFGARLTASGHHARVCIGACHEQQDEQEPYLPMLDALGRLTRAPDEADPADVLRRYAPSWLIQLPALQEPGESARLRQQTAGANPARMLREIAEALDRLASTRPLVLVLEDLHWADPSTVALISALARRREPAKLLLVVTYRPTDAVLADHPIRRLRQDLVARGQATGLPLTFLHPAQAREYLSRSIGVAELSDQLLAAIHTHSEGHPLFLRSISDHLRGAVNLSRAVEELAQRLPDGLKELIAYQHARLPEEQREVLLAASIAGPAFCAAAVAAALGTSVDTVERHCENLVHLGQFLEAAGMDLWPDGTASGRFRFRHALYGQVLRELLGESRQARLHRAIGDRQETAYGAQVADVAAELAHHFESGGQHAKALRMRVLTARTALSRAGYREAEEQVARGLALLDALPTGDARAEAEIALRIIAARVAQLELGYAHVRMAEQAARIEALLPAVQNPELMELATATLWMRDHFGGRSESALRHAERARAFGAERNLPALECCGLAWTCVSQHLMARFDEGFAAGERALERARRVWELAGKDFALEPANAAMIGTAHLFWYRGFPDQALRRAQDARTNNAQLGNPYTACIVRCMSVNAVLVLRREWSALLVEAEETLALSRQLSQSESMTWSEKHRAVALCGLGRVEEGLPRLQEISRAQFAAGSFVGIPQEFAIAAECCLALGRLDEARTALDLGLGIVREQGVRAWETELMRIEARWLQMRGDSRTAEARLMEALHLTRERRAPSLELRVAMDLARMAAARQRRGALERLRELYEQFTEGFDTPDLRDAAGLIANARRK